MICYFENRQLKWNQAAGKIWFGLSGSSGSLVARQPPPLVSAALLAATTSIHCCHWQSFGNAAANSHTHTHTHQPLTRKGGGRGGSMHGTYTLFVRFMSEILSYRCSVGNVKHAKHNYVQHHGNNKTVRSSRRRLAF